MTAQDKLNICVFISGRGSNLKAILEACERPDFPARVSCIISNKPNAGGLSYAEEYGIPYAIISHKDFDSKQRFEDELLKALAHEPVDLICLAGFMRILSPHFLNQWGENIINIHPSLLPKYKGLDTHERAMKAGDTEAGCSIHYVTPELDAGNVIYQKRVKILKKDTIASLEQKVLIQEHIAYPEAIKLVAKKFFGQSDQTEFDLSPSKQNKKESDNMADKNAIKDSQIMWNDFTVAMKYATISIIGILSLLALFLL